MALLADEHCSTRAVASKRTDYVYNKTEQIAKTVIDLINSRTESKISMSYDAQGRLSEIVIDTYTNGVKSQSVTQQYVYDSNGIKIKQIEKIDANADGVIDGENVTKYLIDELNHTGYAQVLEERLIENGQEVKVTTYTIGHDVLAQFDAVNGYLALLADGHGSTRAVADFTGQIIQQYSYDAYGNAHGFNAKDALTNLLYSGEQFNAVSGLQYLRARWYSPQSGRFNRLDPYAGNQYSPLSFHKYAYAHMNPIMGSDPTGLLTITIGQIAVGLGVVGALYGMYYGYQKSNKTLSVETALSMLGYGIIGFGVGFFTGATICAATGAGGAGSIVVGRSAFQPALTTVTKLLQQAKHLKKYRTFSKGGLGNRGINADTFHHFIYGFVVGVLTNILGKEYEEPVIYTSSFVGGALPLLSPILKDRKMRGRVTASWAFTIGFHAGYSVGEIFIRQTGLSDYVSDVLDEALNELEEQINLEFNMDDYSAYFC